MKWEKVEIGDVLTLQRGFDITKKEQKEGEYPVVSSSGIQSFHNDFKVKGEGVVIGRKGSLGTCYFLKQDFWAHDTTLYVKDFKGNDRRFVYYLLQTLNLSNLDVGSSNPTLNRNHVHKINVILPPFPTQRKIASILSAYDDLIENNLKRIKLLEERAFLRYKGIVKSKSLEKVSVFDYANIMSGGTPSTTNSHYWEGEIPFFTPKDLASQSGYYLIDTERKLTELGLEKCNSRLFPRDTIFITARGTVGKLVLAKIPSAISQSNYALTSRNGSANLFLFLALIDKIDHFKQLAVGGVFDTIIVDTFKMIFIEVPDEAVVNQFNIDIKPIFSLIDTLQKQNAKLREARDILLPRLMSGEMEV